jgi:hypothetical protein
VKPIIPDELRDLLALMCDLAQPVPSPKAEGRTSADWERRHDVQIYRRAILGARLESLIEQFEIGDKYPDVAQESLALYCERTAEAIREYLAEPLGFEPEIGDL